MGRTDIQNTLVYSRLTPRFRDEQAPKLLFSSLGVGDNHISQNTAPGRSWLFSGAFLGCSIPDAAAIPAGARETPSRSRGTWVLRS